MGKFMDLNVWRRAKDLAVFVYRLTGQAPFNSDFSLRDQIRSRINTEQYRRGR